MQEVTLIGQVVGHPRVMMVSGRKTLVFTLRAENSPRDKGRSSFDFHIMTSNLSLCERLEAGVEMYVSGLLAIGCCTSGKHEVKAVVQGLVFNMLERSRTADDVKIEMVSRAIPLQSI